MKPNTIKAARIVLPALLTLTAVSNAKAGPWWWPTKAPVKTQQVALPANNGGTISITIPAKSTAPKHVSATAKQKPQDVKANRAEDERIAADLERHF